MNSTLNLQSRARFRRSSQGFLYIAVLFTTLLVMAAVTAALSISTANLRGETDRSSQGEALRFAEGEIHRHAAIMRASSQWRNTATHNVFSDWSPLTMNGSLASDAYVVRYRYHDADGDLADDPSDPVELTVHAKVGRSEAALTVQLESDPKPLSLLQYSMTAADDLRFESGGMLSCARPVQVFDDCRTGSWGMLTTPQLECSGDVQMTLRGDLRSSSVTVPGYDVVAEYVSQGTEIPFLTIPQSGGDLIIEDRVLSPAENPFGAADPSGVYWLDARGNDVVISHCRFDATLAIRDAHHIMINGGMTWSYPTDADAILVTDSPIRLQDVEATLDESARSTNFNPPASPYRQTLSNAVTTDVFPTELRGIIYTSDNFRLDPLVSGACLSVTGTIIAKDIRIDGSMAISQLDELITDPPAGLSDFTPMRFVRGTFRRIPSP